MRDAATTRNAALDYLAAHHVMTLATLSAQGPWAAAVFYANEDFQLYFLSKPSSRHGSNLAQDARVAAAIQEDYRDWPEIKGIQLEGRVELLCGAAADEARRLYARKFPVAGIAGRAPPAIAQALAKVAWYRLVPERLFLIDNSLGFGHREEVSLTV